MQLRKILAAVKPASADAHPAPAALELAGRANARLAILGVTESPWQLVAPAPEAGLGRMPSRGELLSLAADRMRTRLGPLIEPRLRDRVVVHATIGLPAVEIVRWSESEGADLIVLGRESRPRPGRLDGGDTVEGTVRRARVPCLVVAAGEHACRRILAAVDGGPDSRDVLDAALTLGRLWSAAVRALHVDEPALAGAVATTWAHDPPAYRADPLRGLAAAASCEILVSQGDPVAEILRQVREDGTDVLVLGHHRGGPANAHHTRSVAARLLARAPCAVLTIPV